MSSNGYRRACNRFEFHCWIYLNYFLFPEARMGLLLGPLAIFVPIEFISLTTKEKISQAAPLEIFGGTAYSLTHFLHRISCRIPAIHPAAAKKCGEASFFSSAPVFILAYVSVRYRFSAAITSRMIPSSTASRNFPTAHSSPFLHRFFIWISQQFRKYGGKYSWDPLGFTRLFHELFIC